MKYTSVCSSVPVTKFPIVLRAGVAIMLFLLANALTMNDKTSKLRIAVILSFSPSLKYEKAHRTLTKISSSLIDTSF